MDSEHSCGDSQPANSPASTVTRHSNGNVADRLTVMASLLPSAVAIAQPNGPVRDDTTRSYKLTTFGALDEQSTTIAKGLIRWGVRPGMRIAMLVPFGASFIELTFALLKAGATVILIDPGIGRKHLVRCLSEAKPDGFMAIPKAQAIRTVLSRRFPDAKWNVTVGDKWYDLNWLWSGKTLSQVLELGKTADDIKLPKIESSNPAAIIFTTGSTGPPKGVLYTHGTFHAQIDRIRDRYEIKRGSRDLACFPLFGLFDAVMGVTTIIPDMDPTRPADVNPRRLAEAAAQWEIDQAFGSPALWNTVVRWANDNDFSQPFPTLRRILSAGAPVPAATLESLRRLVHAEAEIVTPYGSTEALPIASIESREIISETGPASAKGKGVCVGTRFEGVSWRVVQVDDGPMDSIEQTTEMKQGKIGELMVSGPMVTDQYVVRQDQNSFHKVRDGNRVWHRMGDVGYLDSTDRFWFCGRKAHRVVCGKRTLYTVPCEAVFNAHPSVYRSALIGRGQRPNQTPVILIETIPECFPKTPQDRDRLQSELLNLASRNPLTMRITEIIIRDKPLPVDIRHNSKIFRERLTEELQNEH
ncbi:Long-chain-fatty-acid--CoA ligase [Rubripirellula obstinata]|uniref:Long-chain-fatty-acid--CoA ligase n=1 Tax=Rubripirellula obstinata TaxID=406547 RepID=A0A5B1C966_9BACT|nr:fatty acid CoA ligase family protein [Rubripirellula obstinata]KAA1257667.1 Long-chain-fatty-acid--CoA ligase [Rubripirellula obstinata]